MVALKMLAFDNKSEVQVLLDLPGSSFVRNARLLAELDDHVASIRSRYDWNWRAEIRQNGIASLKSCLLP